MKKYTILFIIAFSISGVLVIKFTLNLFPTEVITIHPNCSLGRIATVPKRYKDTTFVRNIIQKRDTNLSFFITGCTGALGYGSNNFIRMLNYYRPFYQPKFALLMGDNFYNCGVASTDDYMWKLGFEDLFKTDDFPIPFYAILGNHGYTGFGNPKAQIEYSKMNERWRMPDYYYKFSVKFKSKTISFYGLDTELFTQNPNKAAKQLKWLDYYLKTDLADLKIVFGHRPVLKTLTEVKPNQHLEKLKNILLKNKVPIYLTAHHHQLSYNNSDSLNQFISGSGSKIETNSIEPSVEFCKQDIGVTYVMIQEDRIIFDMITQKDGLSYTKEIPY